MSSFIKKIVNKNNLQSRSQAKTITLTFIGDEIIEEDASKLVKKILYNLLSNRKRAELTRLDYSINNLKITHNNVKWTTENKLKKLEDELKAKYECSICMEKPREYVCVPCGHCYCEECCRKMNNNECFTCRNRVQYFQKMF